MTKIKPAEFKAISKALTPLLREAEAEEAEAEKETRYFYVPDIEFPSAMKEVSKSEIGKLPELDYEIGNALIVCERSGDKTTLSEFETKIEDSFQLTFGGEILETEAVETFTAALAALTNIGKGGC